jgi:hypothetical protein
LYKTRGDAVFGGDMNIYCVHLWKSSAEMIRLQFSSGLVCYRCGTHWIEGMEEPKNVVVATASEEKSDAEKQREGLSQRSLQ